MYTPHRRLACCTAMRTGSTASASRGKVQGGCSIAINDHCSDNRTLISGSFDATAIIWSMETRQAVRMLRGHSEAVWAVLVTPDATQRFVTAGRDGTICVWTPQGRRVSTNQVSGAHYEVTIAHMFGAGPSWRGHVAGSNRRRTVRG